MVHPLVTDYINKFFPPQEASQRLVVSNAIENYATIEDCGLNSLIYRMWNAVKSVFYCSDWQIACSTLAEKLCTIPDLNQPGAKAEIVLNALFAMQLTSLGTRPQPSEELLKATFVLHMALLPPLTINDFQWDPSSFSNSGAQ